MRAHLSLGSALACAVAVLLACGDDNRGSGGVAPDGGAGVDGGGTNDGQAGGDASDPPYTCGSPAEGWTTIPRAGAPAFVMATTAVHGLGVNELLFLGHEPKQFKVESLFRVARYDLGTRTWTEVETTGAPSIRSRHATVLVGSKLYLWGGRDESEGNPYQGVLGDGVVLDLATRVWTPMGTTSAPQGRVSPTMVWTGARLLVWGGIPDLTLPNYATPTGALYDPQSATWSPIKEAGTGKTPHAGVWAGSHLVVMSAGTCYSPLADTWTSCGPAVDATAVGFDGGAMGVGVKSRALVTCTTEGDGGCGHADAGAAFYAQSIHWGAGVVGTKVIFFDGNKDQNVLGDGFAYDVSNGTSSVFANSTFPVDGTRIASSGSRLVVWAGRATNEVLGCAFTFP